MKLRIIHHTKNDLSEEEIWFTLDVKSNISDFTIPYYDHINESIVEIDSIPPSFPLDTTLRTES